jgi:hypothetical protein
VPTPCCVWKKATPTTPPWPGAYGFTALGILAKGLIGIVLPAGVLLLWLLWRRSWRFLPTMLWPSGCLLLLLIALPWFFWMQHLYPGFFDYFVVYHHFQRFSETGFNNQVAFWFYIPVILLCALPWSPWFARVFSKTCWTDKDPSGLRSLMAIWLGVIVVFFSLPSSKLVGYILPAIPPFAYLIAESLSIWLDRNRVQAQRWYAGTLAVAVVACPALVVGVALADKVSAKPLAATAAIIFQPQDQLLMVDEYQYDLPFYLQSRQPAWVVSDWNNPEIPPARQLAQGTRRRRKIRERQPAGGTTEQRTARRATLPSGRARAVDMGPRTGHRIPAVADRAAAFRDQRKTRVVAPDAGNAQQASALLRKAQKRLNTKVNTAMATRMPPNSKS